MRVLLIDDHEIVWNGTRRLLERLASELDPRKPFAFEAVHDVTSACTLAADAFDLILLDYHLAGITGVAALYVIKAHFESTPVCLQSAETSGEKIREVIDAGAAGFIPKTYRLEEMEAALRLVLRHRVYLPPEFILTESASTQREPNELAREEMAAFLRAELSDRQRQVLGLAIRGQPIKLIARQLGIADGTVKVHLSMIYRALGARNRTDALCRVLGAQATAALDEL